jgi:HEPN domain-containing protein
VKEELMKGNTFFVTVCQNGLAVYDGDKSSSLVLPSIKGVASAIEKIDERWSKWFGLAERFYGTAVDCATNERSDIAVFMLHQTVESACIAVIRIQTGYRPATRNLKRLLALMENFTLHGLVIFPRITKEETELFNVLHRAYSDVRYKEEYKISGDTVFILIERVKSLLDVAEEIYQGKKTWLESTLASDQINTQELPPFESICIDISADVILQKGESESIRIECNKDISNMIKTSVENKRLWISANTGGPEVFPDATLHITYASLNGLVVNQSGKITCKEPIEASWLGIVQNSNGNISLELNVTTLDVTINKAGNVTISGSADEARIVNHGSGNLNGSELVTDSVSAVIRGSGNASIHVDENLSGELSGSGNLLCKGSPRLKSLSIKGMGGLKLL